VQTARRSAFGKQLIVTAGVQTDVLPRHMQSHAGKEFVAFCMLVFLYLDNAVSAIKSIKDQKMHFCFMMMATTNWLRPQSWLSSVR
jgi:hypothetical protein